MHTYEIITDKEQIIASENFLVPLPEETIKIFKNLTQHKGTFWADRNHPRLIRR